MPFEVKKISPKCWEVVNSETGVIHSKCTTKTKAMAQMRLLYGVESGKWKPTGKKISTDSKGMTYREFVKAEFKKRPDGVSAPQWMKKIAEKWRSMKKK